MKKTTLIAMLTLSCSMTAQAGLFDALIEKFLASAFTSYHGEGLPKKVAERSEAVKYRQEFMDIMGIKPVNTELGIIEYRGNDQGIGLIKKGNDE